MAKSFKNGVSLHRLLEASPLAALEGFLSSADKGQYAAIFGAVQWSAATDDASIQAIRAELIDTASALKADAAVPLDRHAHRILTLAEGRGVETLNRVAAKLFEQAHIDAFQHQLDELGRSLWLYQYQPLLFDEAENLFYADHYRNFGRMYEAFELDADATVDFAWDDAVKAALEEQIQDKLELTGRCTVTHLQVDKKDSAGKEVPQHLLIVRHGGPLSSVAEYQEADGSRQERYYRPLNEATLLFSPDEGVIEVFSASPSVRQQVAGCFAETGLKLDLSGKPLTLKQYNLGRFLDSLRLNPPSVDGFDIEHVAVVEVDARPDNYKHRASLKVTVDDDIEEVAESLFGKDHIFSRATCISRVVISVRYTQYGTDKTKTLNITLSEPNRCNLRSNRDPVQRDLGYALLTAWGILHQVKPLTVADERELFPALLQLFDQTTKEVPGQFFIERGIDPEALVDGGFIERRGRFSALLLEEADTVHEVAVRSAGKKGWIAYDHPVDGTRVEIPASAADKYAIRRDWLDEIVHKCLKTQLASVALTKLDECLTYLGDITLGQETVPCYIARNLKSLMTLQRLDILLRAKSDKGIGLILSAGRDHRLCLGPNVITPIADHLSATGEALLDIDRLASVFSHGKILARGGMLVDLVKHSEKSATLYIPGKAPLMLTGEKQIALFDVLVTAYKNGSPIVKTSDAMAGSESFSPSTAFRKEQWATIKGVYLDLAPGVKRGAWMLLV
jgi:hypothetical protein